VGSSLAWVCLYYFLLTNIFNVGGKEEKDVFLVRG